MKITQYCSVCREELEMDVVPTEDEEEDGVVWLRCPHCRGFLPRIGAAFSGDAPGRAGKAGDSAPGEDEEATAADAAPPAELPGPAVPRHGGAVLPEPAEPWPAADEDDLPEGTAEPPDEPAQAELGSEARGGHRRRAPAAPPLPPEPLDEYAAMLAEVDLEGARPYRPWSSYEIGEVVHHLAWGDHGLVVAKESLPGGRQAVKVYFERAGLVRLIENAHEEP